MDTDSLYIAVTGSCLEDIVKPQLKQLFMEKIYRSCGRSDVEASDEFWFPRKCCNEHDKRTPGLFKLEASGVEMVSLCPKTCVLKKSDDSFKFSCKGINRSSVKAPIWYVLIISENQRLGYLVTI